MKLNFKRSHLLIAALVVGAVLYFRQSQGSAGVGDISARGRTSAMPPGYRSEPPNTSGR